MQFHGLAQLFPDAGLAGHLVLLVVLFQRGRARQFPWFTALIGFNVLRTLVLSLILRHGSDQAYFVAYLGGMTVDTGLQVAVVYEVASHVFRPTGSWATDTRRGLWALVGMSLAVAAGLTWMCSPVAASWGQTLLVRLNFFTATLMSELFVGMVVLSVTVGLPWRTHVARIAHGLGAYSVIDVVIEAGHTLYGARYGAEVHAVLTQTRMVVYLLCLGYWIVTLWQEAPEPRELPAALRAQLRALEAQMAGNLVTLRSWRKP